MSRATPLTRPTLRADLRIVRRESEGVVRYVVRESRPGKYWQFGELEVALMRLMDGTRTPDDIARAAAETVGVEVAPAKIAGFADKLKRLGLVEGTAAEQHMLLMERVRASAKVGARRVEGTLLRLRVRVGDPDRLFAHLVERLSWVWTRAFVWCSAALFAVYLGIVLAHARELFAHAVSLYTFSGVSAWDYVLGYLLFLVIGAIHELGHGLTTKRYGGEVHDMGFMLLYFSPALYCNSNDAWLFERRSHRLWVTFAGPWIQLLLAAVAAIIWVSTEPGTMLYRVTSLAVLVGGITNVLANMNPLLPLDGYFALSDYLEIPNLRRRAFDYWIRVGKRRMLGVEMPEPAAPARERRALRLYGALALAYSAAVVLVVAGWAVLVLRRFAGPWAWLAVGSLLAGLAWQQRQHASTVAHALARAARARAPRDLRDPRAIRALAALVLVVALPFVVPWTFRAKGPFRVEARQRADVRVQVSGVLDRVLVVEGDTVRAGAPLAVLWNADVDVEVSERDRRVSLLRVAHAAAEASGDRDAAASVAAALEQGGRELAIVRRRRDRLVVRAPLAGVVLAPKLEERVGEALEEGDRLLELASSGSRVARVRIPASRAADLARGQTAHLKLSTWPGHKFASRVTTVSPEVRGGSVEVEIPFPAETYLPSPGMWGVAKIVTRHGTLADALRQAVRRTVRLDLWI